MKRSLLLIVLLAALCCTLPARRVKVKAPEATVPQNERLTKIAADSADAASLALITVSGFDKPCTSAKETFFLKNNTGRRLLGVRLEIEYFSKAGAQLHKREVELDCDIPPGEMRSFSIASWDRQGSYYYKKSRPRRNGGIPFDVRIRALACTFPR